VADVTIAKSRGLRMLRNKSDDRITTLSFGNPSKHKITDHGLECKPEARTASDRPKANVAVGPFTERSP
jgi:hypothetical protein